MRRVLILTLLAAISSASQAAQFDWLKHTVFFAYTPSTFQLAGDAPVPSSEASIAQDLQVVRRYGDGLILYATDQNTRRILAQAKALQFNAVILGIWAVTDPAEINHAVELARKYPQLIRAIAVGNEGLFWKRYDKAALMATLNSLRTALPAIALTTTEPFAAYLGEPARLDCSHQDFLLPTIHPVFESWFTPAGVSQSVEFVENIVTRLQQLCHKAILVKETGIPSGPSDQAYSAQQQRLFWQQLLAKLKSRPGVAVALFEAFDAPWKVVEMQKQSGQHDVREQYWGWFTHDRKPKPVIDLLRPHE